MRRCRTHGFVYAGFETSAPHLKSFHWFSKVSKRFIGNILCVIYRPTFHAGISMQSGRKKRHGVGSTLSKRKNGSKSYRNRIEKSYRNRIGIPTIFNYKLRKISIRFRYDFSIQFRYDLEPQEGVLGVVSWGVLTRGPRMNGFSMSYRYDFLI